MLYIISLERLQQLKGEESQSDVFVQLPSNHFFEVANVLLSKWVIVVMVTVLLLTLQCSR